MRVTTGSRSNLLFSPPTITITDCSRFTRRNEGGKESIIIHLISTYDLRFSAERTTRDLILIFSEKKRGKKEISAVFSIMRAQVLSIARPSYRENASRLRLNKPNYQHSHPLEKERHNGETRKDTWLDIARFSISVCVCVCVWKGSLKILVRWSRVDETARNILPRARSAYAISIITLHQDGMLTRPWFDLRAVGQSFMNDGNV